MSYIMQTLECKKCQRQINVALGTFGSGMPENCECGESDWNIVAEGEWKAKTSPQSVNDWERGFYNLPPIKERFDIDSPELPILEDFIRTQINQARTLALQDAMEVVKKANTSLVPADFKGNTREVIFRDEVLSALQHFTSKEK